MRQNRELVDFWPCQTWL